MQSFRIAVLCAFAIPLTIYDLRWRRLPNVLTGSFAFVGLLCAAQRGETLLLMMVCAVIFGAVSIAGVGFGMGDSKLIVGLAAWCRDWQELAACLQWGFGLAGGFAIAAMVFRKLGFRNSIPFGPFLLAGALLALRT